MYWSKVSGYTLIELMITIAIVGILASIAIPSARNYIGRVQVTEGFITTSGLRNDIAAWLWEKKSFPNSASVSNTGSIGQQAYEIKGKYVKDNSIEVLADSGVVIINFDAGLIANKQLVLTPILSTMNNQQISQWQCSGTINKDLLPTSCLQ